MQATYKQQRFMRSLLSQHPTAWKYAAKDLPSIEHMSKSHASQAIDRLSAYVVYNPGSQRAKIAEILRSNGMKVNHAISVIDPMVGTKPLLWSRNSNGQRIPLPIMQQKERMRQTVRQVWEEMQQKPPLPNFADDAPEDSETMESESQQDPSDSEPDWMKEMREAMEGEDSESDSDSESEGEGEEEGESESDEGEGESEMTPEQQQDYDAKRFLEFVRKARKYWAKRNADGITAESIGMRPALNGAKMIRNGIPALACKFAMSIHWPQDARDTLKVEDFDPLSHKSEDVPTLSQKIGESVHAVLPYVVALAKAKVPIALIGTHGTGKTEIARQLASALDLRFGFASMTEGTPPSTFYGRVFPEHVQSVFEDCYANGGVFLFDEMDAAHPNLLLIVNAALANGHFSNTATGETIRVHKDFVPVCAMNTTGLGADRNYTGRKRLDAAALDRWHMGRVKVPIDEKLESALYASILKDASDELEEIPTMEPHTPTTAELEEVFSA